MLQTFLGPGVFQKGLQMYLKKHAYGSTFTEDLWAALEEASGRPVGKMMNNWTKIMGFPLVSVDETISNGSRALILKQTKFCADGNTPETSAIWMIPIR